MLKQASSFVHTAYRIAFWLMLFSGLTYAQYSLETDKTEYEGSCPHSVIVKVRYTGQGSPGNALTFTTKNGTIPVTANWTQETNGSWVTTVTLSSFDENRNGLFWLSAVGSGNIEQTGTNSLWADFDCTAGNGKVSQGYADGGGGIIKVDVTGGGACPAVFTINGSITLRFAKPPRMPERVWANTTKVIYYRFVSDSRQLTPVSPLPLPPVFKLTFPLDATTMKIAQTKWRLGSSPFPKLSAKLKVETLVPLANGSFKPGLGSAQVTLTCSNLQPKDGNSSK